MLRTIFEVYLLPRHSKVNSINTHSHTARHLAMRRTAPGGPLRAPVVAGRMPFNACVGMCLRARLPAGGPCLFRLLLSSVFPRPKNVLVAAYGGSRPHGEGVFLCLLPTAPISPISTHRSAVGAYICWSVYTHTHMHSLSMCMFSASIVRFMLFF